MIGIIGAGISGLVLAYELQKAGVDYIILEAGQDPGGYIRTEKLNDYTLELGPNSILCDEEILSLLNEIGLEEELLFPEEVSKARFILKNGVYEQLPDSPGKLLGGSFFSISTKLKILSEAFKTNRQLSGEETLAGVFGRRFGKEVLEYAVNPFVSGIFAGDPQKLLLRETFPAIFTYIQKYGSILKGLRKNPPVRRQSLSFKGGMQILPQRLASQLSEIRFNSEVTEVIRKNKGFVFNVKDQRKQISVSQIVFCVPAYRAAPLLDDMAPELSTALANIYYPPMTVIHTAFDANLVKNRLNGFGGLHPQVEEKFTSGIIWTSSSFPSRASSTKVLFTSFAGGAQNPAHAQRDESFIRNKVFSELSNLYNIRGEAALNRPFRWNKSIPQYDHRVVPAKRLAAEMESEGIFFCAGWKEGVALPECIKKAKKLAEKLI